MNNLQIKIYQDYIEMLEKILTLRKEFELKIIESIDRSISIQREIDLSKEEFELEKVK